MPSRLVPDLAPDDSEAQQLRLYLQRSLFRARAVGPSTRLWQHRNFARVWSRSMFHRHIEAEHHGVRPRQIGVEKKVYLRRLYFCPSEVPRLRQCDQTALPDFQKAPLAPQQNLVSARGRAACRQCRKTERSNPAPHEIFHADPTKTEKYRLRKMMFLSTSVRDPFPSRERYRQRFLVFNEPFSTLAPRVPKKGIATIEQIATLPKSIAATLMRG